MFSLLNRGFLAILFASFLFGVQSIFMRFIGTGLGVFYPFVIRGFLISVTLYIFLLLTHGFKDIRKKDYVWFLLMPLFGIATFITFFIAINHITIGTVLFLHYASLAITGFAFGYIAFTERLNKVKLSSLLLVLLGLLFIFSLPRLERNLLYFLLALISGSASSAWYLISKKISSKYPYSQILAIDSTIVLLLCALFGILNKETFYFPNISFKWASIVGMTIASFGGYLLTVYGFRFLQAQIASLILLLEVVFGLLLAWIFFFEIPTTQTLLGGFLILIGVALPSLSFKNRIKV